MRGETHFQFLEKCRGLGLEMCLQGPVLHPVLCPAEMGTPLLARVMPGSTDTYLLLVLGLRDALAGCIEGLSLESAFI